MRKLIEREELKSVTCDNKNCNYEEKCTENKLILYVDEPCPKCGQNLLTYKDYKDYINLVTVVNFINKWFSWITLFYSKKSLDNAETFEVHVHEGVNITKKENNQ